MASDNETVAEIVSLMRNEGYYRGFMGITNPLTDRMISSLLDRIEAAHKREKDALMRNLNALEKAVEETCGKDLIERIAARKKEIQNGRQ